MSDTYAQAANRFKPTDPLALAAEAQRLRQVHAFTVEDAAHCLAMSTEAVRGLLGLGRTQ